jgi:hypothetical protein
MKFAKHISAGNCRETVAVVARVDKLTLYNWLKRDSRPEEKKIYKDFLNAV